MAQAGKSSEQAGRLDGRVAIVTGAGQGAGYGVTMALVRKGASLVLFGRTLSKLQKVVDEITGLGGKAVAVAGDVMQEADRQRLIDTAVEKFGRIDVLVNAAQSPEQRDMPMLETSRQMIGELWDSGFVATYELMRGCYPHMKKAGGGSIINFGSAAQQNPTHYSVYGAVKSAIQVMSRAAALEWGPDNIRVNLVVPLVISPAYDLHVENHPGDDVRMKNATPLRRVGRPEEDIGRPVAFLACDESAYITGTTLPLDGGRAFIR
jgi:NAD(P)-dependent dehydrogenase (short-subunit alcohol dehydrogenase family)